MPDLPKIEDPAAPSLSTSENPPDRVTSAPPISDNSSTPETTQPSATDASPPHGFPRAGAIAMMLVLTGVVLYGIAGFLRVTGLYDVSQWWRKSSATPSLAAAGQVPQTRLSTPTATTTTTTTTAADGYSGPLRDQPPREASLNLPQFTVRDGERHDFLTDLDAETLRRLAEIQGQLDGFSALVGHLNQAMRDLTRNAVPQRQQQVAYQNQLQQELTAVRQEIAALQAAVGEVEARLKRAGSGWGRTALGTGPATAPVSGAPVDGWSVTAISGDRAWLRTPKGKHVTVTAGERVKTLGAVRAVDAIQGFVVLVDGRIVR
jgi:hypothetical protein